MPAMCPSDPMPMVAKILPSGFSSSHFFKVISQRARRVINVFILAGHGANEIYIHFLGSGIKVQFLELQKLLASASWLNLSSSMVMVRFSPKDEVFT